MSSLGEAVRIAVLDDYQNVALKLADWSPVTNRASVTVYIDHLENVDEVVERLLPFDVVCVMRERTPLTKGIIERLPKLKLIASTGPRNASVDTVAAAEHGVSVRHTGYTPESTVELTWALILASARHITSENASLRAGGWQLYVGDDMANKTLGIIGLGKIGSRVAKVGLAFGMNVIAWSENLTSDVAAAAGARLVSKEELLREADVISIHLILSSRTIGLIGAPEFALMKPSARLINTSRGPIVVESDLLEALVTRRIAGAAVDVFDTEPLPAQHPFRSADNLLATPHIGGNAPSLLSLFYRETVDNIIAWLDGRRDSQPGNLH